MNNYEKQMKACEGCEYFEWLCYGVDDPDGRSTGCIRIAIAIDENHPCAKCSVGCETLPDDQSECCEVCKYYIKDYDCVACERELDERDMEYYVKEG